MADSQVQPGSVQPEVALVRILLCCESGEHSEQRGKAEHLLALVGGKVLWHQNFADASTPSSLVSAAP